MNSWSARLTLAINDSRDFIWNWTMEPKAAPDLSLFLGQELDKTMPIIRGFHESNRGTKMFTLRLACRKLV